MVIKGLKKVLMEHSLMPDIKKRIISKNKNFYIYENNGNLNIMEVMVTQCLKNKKHTREKKDSLFS